MLDLQARALQLSLGPRLWMAPRSEGTDVLLTGEGEGRGKREEGRGKREEGRGKREEGRGTREEGKGEREEGRWDMI